ncbi:hypothetical protein F2P79_023975 [Pimephales promelas]|nr:hypothetical protein F2P79_023975 [Pimephales promelas]
MDERDSHCPYLLSSETTAKGTGLAESAGKEDPVEIYPKMFVKLKKAGGGVLHMGCTHGVKRDSTVIAKISHYTSLELRDLKSVCPPDLLKDTGILMPWLTDNTVIAQLLALGLTWHLLYSMKFSAMKIYRDSRMKSNAPAASDDSGSLREQVKQDGTMLKMFAHTGQSGTPSTIVPPPHSPSGLHSHRVSAFVPEHAYVIIMVRRFP